MFSAISKIKKKKKKFSAVLYIMYFLVLYLIARFISVFFVSGSDLNLISELHSILISLEVNILKVYFGFFNLVWSVDGNTIFFTNSNSIIVMPGCSGLDPLFRILFIFLLFPGPLKSKLWYIPLSMFLVLIAAVIHLIVLAYVIIYLPEYYGIAHSYIARLIFYSMYFLIWVYWLEKFVLVKNRK